MLRHIGEFVSVVYHDWVALMSGIGGLILSGLAAALPQTPPWIFWVASFVCFFISAYRVWLVQFKRAEEAKAESEAEIAKLRVEFDGKIAELQAALDDRARRREIRDDLSALLVEGMKLQALTFDPATSPSIEEADEWWKKVATYLQDRVEPAVALQFARHSSETPDVPGKTFPPPYIQARKRMHEGCEAIDEIMKGLLS